MHLYPAPDSQAASVSLNYLTGVNMKALPLILMLEEVCSERA
jgi:hypothetical protein